MLKSLATTLALALGLLAGTGAASAQTRLDASGASFPYPLYAKWVATYNAKHTDVQVDYQSTGSGKGINDITNRKVQFAGTDAPLTEAQEKEAPAKLLHIPTVAGPVVMIYNLPELAGKELKLNGEVIAGIYLSEIKTWDDPKIKALNPDLALPSAGIIVVHRADGSGTTFIFTSYLSAVSKIWAEKAGAAATVTWPVGLASPKNDGVATSVAAKTGTIGYVEWAFAEKNKIAYATMVNKDGKEVRASIEGVEAAAASAQWPADMKVSIVNAPGEKSYPIAGFTYLLAYQDLSYLKNKAQAQALVDFINWGETEGQDLAHDKGYASLPKDVRAKVAEELKSITFDGQSLTK